MISPFIRELKQFALIVDIVNESVFKNIGNRLSQYFENSLKADVYEVKVFDSIDPKGRVFLKTLWLSSNIQQSVFSLYKDDGSIRGHASYAVINNKPLWIKSKDGSALKPNSQYLDLWSEVSELPSYRDWGDIPLFTSIILPFGSPTIGFINIEFKRSVDPLPDSKDELREVARIVEIIYGLYKSHQIQTTNTEKAFQNINLGIYRCPLEQSSLFFAFSSHADPEIVKIIKDELNTCAKSTGIRIVCWDEMNDTGNINVQLRKEILDAEYAICYFSEPKTNDDPEIGYIDNSNVVFEAGMFHALTSSEDGKSCWIPIREDKSSSAPFDFATERMLIVKRDAKHKLDVKQFKDDFQKRLESLVQER